MSRLWVALTRWVSLKSSLVTKWQRLIYLRIHSNEYMFYIHIRQTDTWSGYLSKLHMKYLSIVLTRHWKHRCKRQGSWIWSPHSPKHCKTLSKRLRWPVGKWLIKNQFWNYLKLSSCWRVNYKNIGLRIKPPLYWCCSQITLLRGLGWWDCTLSLSSQWWHAQS